MRRSRRCAREPAFGRRRYAQMPLGAELVGLVTRHHLQRRLFFWFGATILLTGMVVATVMYLLTSPNRTWNREVERIGNFTRGRFERVWDKPTERDELAQALSQQLDVDVTLKDDGGRELAHFGGRCALPTVKFDVGRHRIRYGEVLICADRHERFGPSRLLLALMIASATMWGASGVLARRLARPLVELSRVAQDIGHGKLSSRVKLHRHERGEVGILADVLDEMAQRIAQQMADQRALLAAVSHEIRTPLARIRLLVEMARDGGITPTANEQLDKVDREVVEIDALVAELLANSRIDFSALATKALDASAMAVEALERAEVDPTALLFEAEQRAFPGDPTLVARAIHNLLENAKRHGGGVETLRVFNRSGRVVFEVEDAGPGLSAGDEEKIFLPFYRAEKPDLEGRSVGLGLALVRRIAEAHGGRAYAGNRTDKRGARIGIEFALERGPRDSAEG